MSFRTLTARTLAPALLVSMMATAGQCDDENPNPGVLPPDETAFGLSYGEWGAVWWNWAFSSPVEDNPLTDTTGENCGTNQEGHVWFLAGFLDIFGLGGPVERECTVPAGKALFFPIINEVCVATDESETEEEMRACANDAIDAVTFVEASIDGVPLSDLWEYRAESPAFPLVLPEGAILDQLIGLNGTFEPAVTDGYWIMLAPLSVGEHEIHFHGVSPGIDVDITYLLTVKPGKQ